MRDQVLPVTVRRSCSHTKESVPARPSQREEAIEEEGKRKDRTRWDSNPQPLGPKPNALSVAPRDHSCTHYVKSLYIRKLHTERTGLLLSFHFLRPKQGNTSLRLQEKKKKALREDRTPDLSLTKRVLYRLSY